ncbi:MAG: response regulator transcription factor [Rhodospirillaceae bacterium]|nr:response regulator transcription factor [Rhodospirillaceae bacterium]MBT5244147.1 response regulator transcription factor [Rhodospirillaceae bacterium]MBT5561672.1 response regulator transcription factor [Rhodospirillaceae bacterium]MBT6243111.1 response regulator transcription factor [Rhodospirillaceae bacterium]MBT7137869.1 response regulator transcription factor [Rhodospirillaceae bacterium]
MNIHKKPHLLIVEDDEMMQSLLAVYLEQEGYDITAVLTGKDMFSVLSKRSADLILLDLTLPDEDGLTLARQVRARSSVPIIIMTARKGMEDRLAGLDIGADDFLTKPFDPRELVLRVRNVLKRTGDATREENQVVGFDGWKMDMTSRTLTGPDETDVPLTSGEFNLLAALIKSPGRVQSRDYLLDAIARNDEPPSDRMIDVFVSRLRKKIGKNSGEQNYIVTVPGHGYKFTGPLD